MFLRDAYGEGNTDRLGFKRPHARVSATLVEHSSH